MPWLNPHWAVLDAAPPAVDAGGVRGRRTCENVIDAFHLPYPSVRQPMAAPLA